MEIENPEPDLNQENNIEDIIKNNTNQIEAFLKQIDDVSNCKCEKNY